MPFRKFLFVFCLVFVHLCLSSQIQLDWKLIHAKTGQTLPIGEKGLVQEVLCNNGFLPDPFFSDNEKEYLWIEDYQWQFLSDFNVDLDTVGDKKIEIEFPTIDTYALIYLNDVLIGESNNCFHPFRFFIQDKLQNGKNVIKLVFTPPALKIGDNAKNADYPLPAPNDVGKIPVSPYCRKPPYQFGWDWTLRMNTIGLWKPVKIFTYQDARYCGAQVETLSISDNSATLKVDIFFSDTLDKPRKIKSQFLGEHELSKGQMSFNWNIEIKNPNLWFPKELGKPYLYEEYLIIRDQLGNIEICDSIKFGIRKAELRRPRDQWGQGYEFYINNQPVFCKGANVIPQEIFPSRINTKTIENLIHDAVKSNFNMLRVWGGGYYPDDYFYELCDQNGIMVWQDFMFAGAFYKADTTFLQQIEDELIFQIPRISTHPSVVLFNGNNEIEVAWKNWGLQETYQLSEDAQYQIWNDYQFIFEEFIPKVKNKLSNIPYIPTSPLSNWGKLSDFNFGSQHYWGLWHGQDSLNALEYKIGRFNAEYGFQSFPTFKTLKSFSDSSDWNLESVPMKSHQKSYVGSQKIVQLSDQMWGKAKDFSSFVYLSQLTQAEVIGRSIVAHRLDYPRCMGTLYWQFNDCWPAPTWSGIDYFGNWKALQYRVKEEYEQMTILRQKKMDKTVYYLSMSNGWLRNVQIEYVCRDLQGKIISEGEFVIDSLQSIVEITDFLKLDNDQAYILSFYWEGENQIGSRHFLENYISSERIDSKISFKLKKIDYSKNKAELVIKTDAFLPYCWIYNENQLVTFENNFTHLLPGKHKIEIEFKDLPKISDFRFLSLKEAVHLDN